MTKASSGAARAALSITAALMMFGFGADRAGDQPAVDVVGDAQVKAAVTAMGADAKAREALPGAKLFAGHCSGCHLGGVEKAPSISMIGMMTPEAVVAATHGIMQAQASGLTDAERLQIAEYLTGHKVGDVDSAAST